MGIAPPRPLLSFNCQAITEEPALGNCKNSEYTTILLTAVFINYNISSRPCQLQVALRKAQFEAKLSRGSEKRLAASRVPSLYRRKALLVLLQMQTVSSEGHWLRMKSMALLPSLTTPGVPPLLRRVQSKQSTGVGEVPYRASAPMP